MKDVINLTTQGTTYGPVASVPGGKYFLSLLSNAHGAKFALQALHPDGSAWENIATPELKPGPDSIPVELPAGLIRLDVQGVHTIDVFAMLFSRD